MRLSISDQLDFLNQIIQRKYPQFANLTMKFRTGQMSGKPGRNIKWVLSEPQDAERRRSRKRTKHQQNWLVLDISSAHGINWKSCRNWNSNEFRLRLNHKMQKLDTVEKEQNTNKIDWSWLVFCSWDLLK